MQTSKSSPNINNKKYSKFGFVAAIVLHIPVFLLAIGVEFMPQKVDIPAKEIGAMSFSLASFAPPPPPEVAPQPEPEPAVIPKHYEPPKPKKKPKEHKKVERKKEHKKIERREPPKEERHVETTQQSDAKAANASENRTASMQDNQPINLGSNLQNPFLAEIKRLIDEHNSYPRMARRMGLTGEVVVRMVLDQNGKITELRVIKSSTHSILDNQTIRAIQEASRQFSKPDKPYILHIPIEYQLNRG